MSFISRSQAVGLIQYGMASFLSFAVFYAFLNSVGLAYTGSVLIAALVFIWRKENYDSRPSEGFVAFFGWYLNGFMALFGALVLLEYKLRG